MIFLSYFSDRGILPVDFPLEEDARPALVVAGDESGEGANNFALK